MTANQSNYLDKNELLDTISQIGKIDDATLKVIADEIAAVEIPYQISYGEYQSGGWHTAMLYNPTGDVADNEISDGVAIPTDIVNMLPKTKDLIENLGLDLFAVRLAKMDPEAYLWEHKDYIELGEDKKLRLHIPIITNDHALMQFGNCTVHMSDGYVWKLDPTINHAASNTGEEPRVHIILDVYVTPELEQIIARETLSSKFIQPLPILDANTRHELLVTAKKLLQEKGGLAAEAWLLKSFHSYDLGCETTYDILKDFYSELGFREREQYWIKEGISRMTVREKKNSPDSQVSMRGISFSPAHDNGLLLQYALLENVLENCRSIEGFDSAYLRGSLSRGDADDMSDIDFLCVVSPEHYTNYIECVNKVIHEKYNVIGEPWADPIVKDFGGMGFVYLIQIDDQIHQLDLYISALGSPGLVNLDKLPAKQQIFQSKTDKTLPIDNKDSYIRAQYALNANEITQTINQRQTSPNTPESIFNELGMLSFMIHKGLQRGEKFVVGDEFNMWKKTFIKLMRIKFDPDLIDYGFYHVNRLRERAKDGGKIYDELVAFTSASLTSESFLQIYSKALQLYQEHFPNASQQSKLMGIALEDHFYKSLNGDPYAHATQGLPSSNTATCSPRSLICQPLSLNA